jgi:hypothetical protein
VKKKEREYCDEEGLLLFFLSRSFARPVRFFFDNHHQAMLPLLLQ